MERFAGSFEVIDVLTGDSRSVPGRAIDAVAAEIVLHGVEGLTDLAAVEPAAVGGTVPVAAWEGMDAGGRPVEVRLWREYDSNGQE
jgi:hypothetical protein